MIHRIEDGDILKILPFIIDGTKKWGIETKALFTKSGNVIYEDDTKYLTRLCNFSKFDMSEYGEKFKFLNLNLSTRYCFNILINGEIKVMLIGKTIMDIIKENNELINLDSNKHLFISKKKKTSQFFAGLYSYDNTHVVDKEFDYKSEDWIFNNQPDFISFIKGKSPGKMMDVLIDEFGREIIDALASKERDVKLESVLEKSL